MSRPSSTFYLFMDSQYTILETIDVETIESLFGIKEIVKGARVSILGRDYVVDAIKVLASDRWQEHAFNEDTPKLDDTEGLYQTTVQIYLSHCTL